MSSVLSNDRESFDELDRLESHWERPFKRSFYWMLTFSHDHSVAELVRSCQQELNLPFLDPIESDDLHLTMRRASYGIYTDEGDALQNADGIRTQLSAINQFRLGLFPMAGSPRAVRMSVFPWEPLIKIFDIITDGDDQQTTVTSKLFRPHVGVGYVNQSVSARPVIERVIKLRRIEPHWTTVKSVDLVDLRREGSSYKWDTVLSCDLGSRTI
ncbi:hypothetical protein [Lentzea guizhouensis]|uniref:hypothetical protein n=1 Tax=Lentzea guizhouensis TaxID=1586287 RepID=UPI0012B6A079|nr:hypothetical protein [Lentzea guizhouensis]